MQGEVRQRDPCLSSTNLRVSLICASLLSQTSATPAVSGRFLDVSPLSNNPMLSMKSISKGPPRGEGKFAPAAYKWHMRKSVCGFEMSVRAHHLRMLWRIQTCKDLAATNCKLISRSRRARCHRVRRIRTLLAQVSDCTLKGN